MFRGIPNIYKERSIFGRFNYFTLKTPQLNLWHLVCLLRLFRTYPKQRLSTGILLVVFWFTVIILEKCNFSPGLKGLSSFTSSLSIQVSSAVTLLRGCVTSTAQAPFFYSALYVWCMPVFSPLLEGGRGVGSHGWVARICPSLKWLPLRSWLSILEAPGCFRHSNLHFVQGSYGSCKTWKVLEFYCHGIFQDWKVLEKG